MNTNTTLFTIGHSSHTFEDFLQLLKMNDINAIADVRSSPYSGYNPQFNRELLKKLLEDASISYVFMGEEFGARRSEPECYENNRVRYDRIAETRKFRDGIERVAQGAAKMRIAMMCSEKDPLTCHRMILVARHIAEHGAHIHHILEDGSIESHESAEDRLLRECRLSEHDLFSSRDDRLDQAYKKRESKIAYTEETQVEMQP